ncbi:hypothetical protein RYA99_04630 [Pseudomonas syringae pv. actinidifoliorum]|uniref:Uncharacterized protein n=1 Tax=Pseudomonas syringae pv. theae TaxID=103985 RepID=A0A3M5MVN0_PSESX|nr:hypothetical protein [Pseudomonas syringae]MDU8432093.1 hypothetical protein [Pseudomonas syringae pv. actinidifoliorum]MBL3872706.1 hypothetical protein [Pseudomonas syringae pv. theae]MDU8519405.1 hypothetical protein [Pseudomonas syringae pv. actinidifoliorum]MDU8525455.1 hypothetical protein [Pseudomonas syringae pv. actinidifoliorum]RMT64140.1 hypothetical protein ALP44_01325 [Pseudomonas syringae pv. theae]
MTASTMTKLEKTIFEEVADVLKILQGFAGKTLSDDDHCLALDMEAGANALIKLARFDSGMGDTAKQLLCAMIPTLASATEELNQIQNGVNA